MVDSDLVELENLKSQLVTSNGESLRSQNATLETGRGKQRKYLLFAFTEQGVSMLSAVLRSETAIKVSIQIMNAFVGMRKFIAGNAAIFQRLDSIEQKQYITDTRLDNDEFAVGASLKDLGKKMFVFSKFDKGALDVLGRLSYD